MVLSDKCMCGVDVTLLKGEFCSKIGSPMLVCKRKTNTCSDSKNCTIEGLGCVCGDIEGV